MDGSGNVFVAGSTTKNVFKITPEGTITQIIDATGDGTNLLESPQNVAVDTSDNVYVSGALSDNAFRTKTTIEVIGDEDFVVSLMGDGQSSVFCLDQ